MSRTTQRERGRADGHGPGPGNGATFQRGGLGEEQNLRCFDLAVELPGEPQCHYLAGLARNGRGGGGRAQ